MDEEHDSEPEIQENPEHVVMTDAPVTVAKEPERQLSKKEIKKMEEEKFYEVLAELNITPNDTYGHGEHHGNSILL